MKIVTCEAKQDRFCNECRGQDNVKEVYIAKAGIVLCEDCRRKLESILNLDHCECVKRDILEIEMIKELKNS